MAHPTRVPWLKIGNLPSLCAMGPRLLTMTGLFRVWMINHFTPGNTESEQLTRLVWDKDVRKTGIVIESHTAWDPQTTGATPAVVIKRQAWRKVRLGIADKLMGELPVDGIVHYTNLWEGAHTFFCVGGESGEVEMLAAEVFGELNEFADAVRSELGLMRLTVAEVGEVAILEEASQNFVVPITVGYGVQHSWRLKQELPYFKRVDAALLGL